MELDRRICDRARRSRDARFDGRFFIGVATTGIYCRPICPARSPLEENVRYFVSAAAAEAAGFRPCLRCRPEAAPGTPAWAGTSGVVTRALRLIDQGALDAASVEQLAGRVGVTGRHLRRLFVQHLGAAPLDVALTRRAHCAKRLLDETMLSAAEVALAAGFGSVRRFNAEMRRRYQRTPTELRRIGRQCRPAGEGCYRFRLAYRTPYDWPMVLAFLAARATPGVEAVEGGCYRRTIAFDGRAGVVEVGDGGNALSVAVKFPDSRALLSIVDRVRMMFDVAADPILIQEQLAGDPLLRAPIARHPGVRTPGAWDWFELAVRAILGQQISVRAATTIAGRLALMFGSQMPADGALTCLFPTPAQLADAPIERAGVMPARAATIRTLAARAAGGTLGIGVWDPDATIAELRHVPGIGRWTAEYIAMRAFGEPDAFPYGDLVLRRLAGNGSPADLERRSQPWRPWRAYAVMLLWQTAVDIRIDAVVGTSDEAAYAS